MTLNALIHEADQHGVVMLGTFLSLPACAAAAGFLHGPGGGGRSPWCYVYAALLYLACVPGMFAAVLTAYALFISHENLLNVSLFVYGLPLVAMIGTLVLVRQRVAFALIPGFERLAGFMWMVGLSFGLALFLVKTSVLVFFGGSVFALLAIASVVFGLLKWATYQMGRAHGAPSKSRPHLSPVELPKVGERDN